MKIGIVLHPYGEKKPGGLPRIIYGWAEALISADSENQYIIYLKEKPEVMPTFGGRAEVVVLGSGRFWLNRLRRAKRADVYLFNTPVLPLFWKPKRTVLIALDYPYMYLKAESFKEKLFRVFIRAYHRYSLKRVDHIIAVSHSTEKDTMRFFNIPQEKISVIYHGFTNVGALPESPLDVPEKFFFFAGTMKERKNVLNIIKAFEIFLRRAKGAPHSLVLAGKNEGSYYEQLLSYIKKAGLENGVKFIGHLNENQLSLCYKRAEALVFPSIIEGTGFPILEAMSAHCPVITSNIFGPAELGANGGAVLVNPYKPEEIASAMEKISTDASFRGDQIKRGIEQAGRFSWTNTGKETLELLTRISRKEKWRMMDRLNLATKILTPLSFILSPFIFPLAKMRRTEEKILIVPHLTRVGEVVVVAPVIAALKARFPNAKIYALVSMKVSGLLEADPNIHELIIIEKYKYNLRNLLSRIRGERFKIAISLSGTPWSSLLFFFGLVPERFKLVQEHRPFLNFATDWLSNRRAKFKNGTSILTFY